jgi:flavin-dependent dehydrogenase
METNFDVAILGGGLAGLSLAIQIKNARPSTTIFLAEKRCHPVPEAAFKVGESSSESGAHYFANVLGMKQHMEDRQLKKLGLRFFFTAGDNSDITQRVESGPTFLPYVPGFQLDRGRFENHLTEECRARGVVMQEGVSVRDVSIEKDPGKPHSAVILRDGHTFSINARWIVDAAGRSGLVRRRLGLHRDIGHAVNASWFRIADVVAVESWSNDKQWQAHLPDLPRSLSTTHLMGAGYWVWLIRLSSGSTSVGIVADESLHPLERINTFERCLDWLHEYEPQCAHEIEKRTDKLQDFCTLRHFAHGATRVYSHHRWCLAGDAGPFTDPLYSPGSDFIGFGNTYITDLVSRDLEGENILRRVELYNRHYLSLYDSFLSLYENQYSIMGNAQVQIAKIVWDFTAYWTNVALLFFRRKLCDYAFMTSNLPLWEPMFFLNRDMQKFFKVWAGIEHDCWEPAYIDLQKIPFLYGYLHRDLAREQSDTELRATLEKNARLLNDVAVEIARRAIGPVEDAAGDSRAEALLAALPESIRKRFSEGHSNPEIANDLERIWLTPAAVAESMHA